MAKPTRKPVDWDAMELQVFNLRFEPISSEDQLEKARKLAITFREHGQPLPNRLANIDLMLDEHIEPWDPEDPEENADSLDIHHAGQG